MEPSVTQEHDHAAARIGEVVEAASHRFVAQCYQLYQAPPLGALVSTTSPDTYAVVCGIATEALDPGRRVLARGENEESEEDIYRSNPQLSRLLCTRFEALIVGHTDGDSPVHRLPPLPPRVHAFVYSCSAQEAASLTHSLDFLHTLVTSGLGNSDEVVSACVRQLAALHPDGRGFLVQAGKHLARELAGDLPRLNAILRRLSS